MFQMSYSYFDSSANIVGAFAHYLGKCRRLLPFSPKFRTWKAVTPSDQSSDAVEDPLSRRRTRSKKVHDHSQALTTRWVPSDRPQYLTGIFRRLSWQSHGASLLKRFA